jgi:TM2 domain-containing membrane protein YozV
MFCPNCGTRVDRGVTACPTCGTNLSGHLPQLPPPPPPPPGQAMVPAGYGGPPAPPPGYSDKSKVAAGLMQIFLGPFGAGRFYTGHTGLAIGQIAATWLTCGVGWLWPFIDGILMLAGKVNDADGRPLRD